MDNIVLDAWQLLVIGGLASVLVQVLKLIAAKAGVDIHRGWLTVIAFVLSVVLAFIFFPVSFLIVPDDPMATAQNLITAAATLLGSASVVYNVLLEKLFEKWNLTKERYLNQSNG